MTDPNSAQRISSGHAVVARARSTVTKRVNQLGLDDLCDDAALVTSELATNAVLHGGGLTSVEVTRIGDGVRVTVTDRSPLPPILPAVSETAMTGRGLRLVSAIAARWGYEPQPRGKAVWADLDPSTVGVKELSAEEVLAQWADDWDDQVAAEEEPRYEVVLDGIPTDLLLEVKTQTDNLVREFTLAAAGASTGMSEPVPPDAAALVERVISDFADVRLSMKRQAAAAANRGDRSMQLRLVVPLAAADAAEAYLTALEDADRYCAGGRLLTLASTPEHHDFRRWYTAQLARLVRDMANGAAAPGTATYRPTG